MHKNEPKLEVLIKIKTDATPNKEGVIISTLTEKQMYALNSQIHRQEKEVKETK